MIKALGKWGNNHMDKLKVLVFDIETSDMLVSTFGIRDQFINDDQIVRDIRVLAIGAKWLGHPVMYREARKPHQEKALLRWVWNLLDEADIVVGHNSKKFDSKMLTARFIIHGMNPPSPYKHLDTLIISKSVGRFSSHKLSYMTKTVNKKYQKSAHAKFSGRSLWLECMAGNKKAWEEMKKYNIHDVLSTEELYMKLRAWAPKNAPNPFHVEDAARECGICGSAVMVYNGSRPVKGGYVKRYQCRECGHWQKGNKVKSPLSFKEAA